MIIVGAGVIGLEIGSIYSRLGTEVTVLEYFDKVLNGMDHDISKNFKAILQKQGFKFHLNCSVSMIAKEKKGVKVTFQSRESDDCLLYTSPSPRDGLLSRMPSSA